MRPHKLSLEINRPNDLQLITTVIELILLYMLHIYKLITKYGELYSLTRGTDGLYTEKRLA